MQCTLSSNKFGDQSSNKADHRCAPVQKFCGRGKTELWLVFFSLHGFNSGIYEDLRLLRSTDGSNNCKNSKSFGMFADLNYINPRKWSVPCPVTNSVIRAATKPIIARRPFKSSAEEVKPNCGSSFLTVVVLTMVLVKISELLYKLM